MVPEKKKLDGQDVRRIRAVLRMERDALAKLLGISVETLKNVEYGCQVLGAAASRRLLDLEDDLGRSAGKDVQVNPVNEVHDSTMHYGTGANASLDRIIELVLDPESTTRAAQVAAGLCIAQRQALAMVVTARLKEK